MEQSLLNEALIIDPGRTVALTIDMQRAYLDARLGDKALPAAAAEAVVAAFIAELTGDSVNRGPALGRRPESLKPDQEKSRT